MAMRLYSIEEFEAALKELGCIPHGGWRNDGRIWRKPNRRFFQVPLPEEPALDGSTDDPFKCRYPDWMLHEIIVAHSLTPPPVAPSNSDAEKPEGDDGDRDP